VPRPYWNAAVDRAASAPAELVPGLLTRTLREGGVPVGAARDAEAPELVAVDPSGVVTRDRDCEPGICSGVTVASVSRGRLPGLVDGLQGEDLLIAIERPPPSGRLLTIGIAGTGFEGNLTSTTTRTDGYVTSTDVAPTILGRYGLATPPEMSGDPITAESPRDPATIEALGSRFGAVSSRRGPVIAVNLMLWIGIAALVALVRRRWAPAAAAALAATMAWAPGVLVVSGGFDPSLLAERLIVGLGAPALAIGSTLALAQLGRRRAALGAFALGALASVAVVAVDVVLGSGLTSVSLIGPNPGLGVRFYGIGNELEATIAALIALGVGAAVAAREPADPARAVVTLAAAVTLLAIAALAPGRFGADVGAAITLPAGAAGLAIAALGAGRRRAVWIVAAPIVALGALVAVDLIAGGDSHLSRSVLDAGGLDQLGEVLERRVRLGASSFVRYATSPYFIVAVLLFVAGFAFRARLLAWMEGRIAIRAGFAGALTATVVGTLANDSGALLLMLGAAFLAAFSLLAWATRPNADPPAAR
jgi:hypothetical protein